RTEDLPMQRKLVILMVFGIFDPVIDLKSMSDLMHQLSGDRGVAMTTNSNTPIEVGLDQLPKSSAFVVEGIRMSMKNVKPNSVKIRSNKVFDVGLIVIKVELNQSDHFSACSAINITCDKAYNLQRVRLASDIDLKDMPLSFVIWIAESLDELDLGSAMSKRMQFWTIAARLKASYMRVILHGIGCRAVDQDGGSLLRGIQHWETIQDLSSDTIQPNDEHSLCINRMSRREGAKYSRYEGWQKSWGAPPSLYQQCWCAEQNDAPEAVKCTDSLVAHLRIAAQAPSYSQIDSLAHAMG
ncbi:MAG: hypothetical protein LQ341_001090, partial [Variospora aurantia]